MAERKRAQPSSASTKSKAEDTAKEENLKKAEEETQRLDAEARSVSALDDPQDPERGSPWRQTAYLVGVVAAGFILNLLILVVLSGGK
jgi:hypothetical protein